MSGFTIPNTPDAFSQNQAEPDSLDFQILGSADTGVVSGMDVVPGSSVTVDVLAGEVLIKGVYYRLANNKLSLALTSAGTDGFFDIVYARINGANTVDVYVTGTATGPNPRFPATGTGVGQINTDTDVVLASVWRTANVAPTSQHIIDKRIFVRSNGNRVANTAPTNGTAIGSGSAGDTYVNTSWVTNATNLSSPLSVKVGNTWYNLAKYSENFSAGTITANLIGNVTGTVTGNVTGTAGGVAWSNISGVPAIVYNNGGTYSVNITGSAGSATTATSASSASTAGYLSVFVNVDPLGGNYIGWSSSAGTWTVEGGFRVTSSNFYLTGIGTTPSAANMRLLGDGRVAYNTSLRKYKEQINSFDNGLSIINSLTPRTFKAIPQETDGVIEEYEYNNSIHHGFIVDEIIEVQPQLIDFGIENGEIVPQMWKTNDVISILVQSVQELSTRLEALEAQ